MRVCAVLVGRNPSVRRFKYIHDMSMKLLENSTFNTKNTMNSTKLLFSRELVKKIDVVPCRLYPKVKIVKG